mgnify:FL=1
MLRERANAQARQLAAYAAEHCALLERRFTTRRARVYLRLAEDPPEHPARPPCTLKNGWSMAPPHNTLPAYRAGEARAGPRPVRRFAFPRGGDG